MYDVPPQEQEELEKIKKEALRKILTKEAMERLGRVRIVNPILTQQVELYLLQLFQAGQIRETIDDEKLKEMLTLLSDKKRRSVKK